MHVWAEEILDFWFSRGWDDWWKGSPQLDAQIRERFEEKWTERRQRPPESFLNTPEDALAAVILFDQFPRNMFRGHAEQFASDPLALAIAKAAVDRGYDERLTPVQRGFLYMPFQHSEVLDDQQRSMALFTALGDAEQLRYAQLHHDVVERFGRFPHRNEILGRQPRADEIAAGKVVPW
jgi:uncharacterized protein (DUF924 family)